MRKTPVLLSLLLSITGLSAISPPTPVAAAPRAATYTNPVSAGTVDTFPDPATIKAKNGKWYAYGTTNPIFNSSGETGEHILPILSSTDLVHWSYEGDVFALNAKPSWWPSAARQWAPDIRYFNNTYYLTYAQSTGGIGLVTSPNPDGPWTDKGLIVPNGSGCPSGTIDQAMFQDTDGSYYLYWGSYDTICVSKMNDNATGLTGTVTTIARGRRMEGGFVIHRGGYYYLFYSDGGCCDGAFSGYVTKIGRATSPTGPFTSPGGLNLMDDTSKDGIVAAANGNGWVGPGHNSITTDLAGQDWLVYHAISETNPDFPAVTGANGATLNLTRRPLLIDRLDWINGWPVINAGAGPSAGTQTAPVTTWTVGSTFSSTAGFGTNWSLVDGHLSTSTASTVLSNASVSGDVRVEGDVRGTSAGIVAAYQSANRQIAAWLDSSTKRMVVSVGGTQTSAPLPANFNYNSWHTIVLEKRGTALYAEVSADRLHDPVAALSVTVPAGYGTGRIGAVSQSGAADVDNLGAAPLYKPVTRRVANPTLGAHLAAYSDEFNGTSTGAGWSWVRGNPGATVSGGSLVWPTQQAELYLGDNSASVLTRDAPTTDFVVETKLTFDGTRGNQQAGMVLYENDDRFVKLVHSVLPLSTYGAAAVQQTTEFTKEYTRTSTGQTFSGPMFGGPAPATTWLRLAYHYDAANNANDIRMASSTNGTTWEWGGAWSFPRVGPLKIGLVSMNTAGATGTFDYVRTYRLNS